MAKCAVYIWEPVSWEWNCNYGALTNLMLGYYFCRSSSVVVLRFTLEVIWTSIALPLVNVQTNRRVNFEQFRCLKYLFNTSNYVCVDPLKKGERVIVCLLDLWIYVFASSRLSEVIGVDRKRDFLHSSNQANDSDNVLCSVNLWNTYWERISKNSRTRGIVLLHSVLTELTIGIVMLESERMWLQIKYV